MNRIDIQGRTAVVTGGARGIGYAIAARLLESGATVSLWDIDAAATAAAVTALGPSGPVSGEVVNVADEASVARAAANTRERLGRIDILVNNAGITGPNAPTWEYPVEAFRQVVEVDLIAVFLCCRAVVPSMVEHGYGRIINVASIAGKEGNPQAPAYSAAKAGVIGLTKTLGKELATKGVIVNCVTPGAAKTDLFKQMTEAHIAYMRSRIPMDRFMETREIAALVSWLASEECSFSTGAVFDASGGRAVY